MGPKHSSNDDVLETGLSNNAQARVSVLTVGELGVRRGICMLAGAEGPVAPPRPNTGTPHTFTPRTVRCILKALWKQLNVRLMAKSWQNDCTIELAVMMAHITR